MCWPIQPVGALRVPRNRLVNAARAYMRIIVVAVSRFRPPTAGAPVQYKCDNWPWSIFCAKRTTVRPMRHVTCVYLCRRSNNRLPETCYPPNITSNYCRRRALSTEQNRYLNNNFYVPMQDIFTKNDLPLPPSLLPQNLFKFRFLEFWNVPQRQQCVLNSWDFLYYWRMSILYAGTDFCYFKREPRFLHSII